jgi:hypothetical protein
MTGENVAGTRLHSPPSTPELAGGEPGAFNESLELGPRDLRVNAATEAAIGRGDDPLAADEIREPDDAVGDERRQSKFFTV